MKLAKSIAIVTGGASGLGRAVVENFIRQGVQVGILDLPRSQEDRTISVLGSNAMFSACDVSDENQVEKALLEIQQHYGAIHIAVNCAGVVFGMKTLQKNGPADLKTFRKTIDVNLIGTFNVCRLAAKIMSENTPNEEGERGVLINTSSIAAFDGQMGQVAYAASKGAIAALTLPMARDLAGHGIRVMSIAPGIFDTPMLASLPEAARQSLSTQIPFPSRFGKTSEFASLVQQIVENPMLNGEVIRLDGALRMGMK